MGAREWVSVGQLVVRVGSKERTLRDASVGAHKRLPVG